MTAQPIAMVVAAKALDGLTLRMAAIADNLANVNSPDFRSVKVDFETALRTAAQRGPDAVRELRFAFQPGAAYGPGDERRVDLMLADAAQTANRYAAVVDMLGRRFAIHQAAVGGRG